MNSVPNDPSDKEHPQDDVEYVSHYADEDGPECVEALLLLAGYGQEKTVKPVPVDAEREARLKALAQILANVIKRDVDAKLARDK